MRIAPILSKLETRPGDRALLVALAVGVLALVVSFVLFLPHMKVLEPSGYSIVDQQTVFTYEANEKVLAAWKAIDGGIHASLMCAWIDLFPFMPAYALVAFAWGTLVARRRAGKLRRIGIACSLCIFPAWIADIVETGIQAFVSLRMESYPPELIPVMSTAAVIKLIFFYTALLWCLTGTLILIIVKLRGRSGARKLLRWTAVALAATVFALLGVVIGARLSDGPLDPLPFALFQAGPLRSGELVTGPEPDWSFARDIDVMEFQLVDPPRSRHVWLIVHEGKLYVPSGYMNSWWGRLWKQWPVDAMQDGRAVIRIAGKRYEREAIRVTDPHLFWALREEALRKYRPGEAQTLPEELPSIESMGAWYFELAPRESGGS